MISAQLARRETVSEPSIRFFCTLSAELILFGKIYQHFQSSGRKLIGRLICGYVRVDAGEERRARQNRMNEDRTIELTHAVISIIIVTTVATFFLPAVTAEMTGYPNTKNIAIGYTSFDRKIRRSNLSRQMICISRIIFSKYSTEFCRNLHFRNIFITYRLLVKLTSTLEKRGYCPAGVGGENVRFINSEAALIAAAMQGHLHLRHFCDLSFVLVFTVNNSVAMDTL